MAYEVPAGDPKFSLDDQLAYYVQRNDSVRDALSGFVCHAVSEWDPANNDPRYQDLNRPDGYFGKCRDTDPDGYDRFIGFVKKLQFMDQVPSLAGGRKFWFFHPLAFIRHFRKCGWLSDKELARSIPRTVIDQTKDHNHQIVYPTAGIAWRSALSRSQKFISPLNSTLRKYGISINGIRLAYFLGNAIQESIYLSKTAEVGGTQAHYAPWYGRGIIQLTFEENYRRYGDYKGWHTPPESYRNSLESDPKIACDSAGFYWVSCAKSIPKVHNINREGDVYPVMTNVTLSNICASYDYHTHACAVGFSTMSFRHSTQFERAARAVNTGSPDSTGPMNGLVPRMNVFLAAMAVMSDDILDFPAAYEQKND